MRAIHGRNHAPKPWEKVPQLTSPIPAPHSATHSSRDRCSTGAGLVPFVAFQEPSRAACNLSPHFKRSTALAPTKHAVNTKRNTNELRPIASSPLIISAPDSRINKTNLRESKIESSYLCEFEGWVMRSSSLAPRSFISVASTRHSHGR